MTGSRSKIAQACCALVLLGGCTSVLKEVGREPEMTVSSLPVHPEQITGGNNAIGSIDRHSTWTDQAAYLFSNRRTHTVGDIFTVQIAIDDQAQLSNKSNRDRTGAKSLGLAGSFAVAGNGTSANMDASLKNATNFNVSGGTARSETIRLTIAVIVVSVLPNKNLVVRGTQEVRVNSELRVLSMSGVVNPSDIQPDNTISHERIAEVRFSYGGKGRITEVQQPASGQQLLDRISPL